MKERTVVECVLDGWPIGILTERDRADLRFMLETRADLLEVLRQVKAWRDSDGNEPFPHETRLALEAAIAKAEGRP